MKWIESRLKTIGGPRQNLNEGPLKILLILHLFYFFVNVKVSVLHIRKGLNQNPFPLLNRNEKNSYCRCLIPDIYHNPIVEQHFGKQFAIMNKVILLFCCTNIFWKFNLPTFEYSVIWFDSTVFPLRMINKIRMIWFILKLCLLSEHKN